MKPVVRKILMYLPVIVLVVAGGYALRGFDWQALERTCRKSDLNLLALVVILNAPHIFLKSERWRVMLRPFAIVPAGRLFHYLVVAFAASVVLPGRAGEIVRVYLLRRRYAVPVTASVGIAAVEKVFEVVGVALVLAPLPFLAPTLPPWFARAVQLLFVGVLVAVIALAAISRRPAIETPWLRHLLDGIACVRSPSALALAVALSVGTWLVDALKVSVVLYAMHIDVPWFTPFVILLTLNLAIVIPSTPGNLATFEAGAVAGLMVFGVPQETALAFALVHHVTQIVPVLLAGLSGFSLIEEARQELGEPAPKPTT